MTGSCLLWLHLRARVEGLLWWSSGLESAFQMQGKRVRSLVGELRAHVLWGNWTTVPQLLSCVPQAHMPQVRTPFSQINKLNIFKKRKKWKEPRLKIIWQHCVEWIEVRKCWLPWERTINYCICLRKCIQIWTKVFCVSERGNKVYSTGQFTWYWW